MPGMKKTGSHTESKRSSSLLKTGLGQVHVQTMPVPTPALEGGKVHLRAAGSLVITTTQAVESVRSQTGLGGRGERQLYL